MLGGAEMDGAAANREVAAIRTSAAKRTNAMKMEFFMMSFLDVLASKKRTPGKKVFVVVSLFGFAGELPKQNLGSELCSYSRNRPSVRKRASQGPLGAC
jgi:hypothetical protein